MKKSSVSSKAEIGERVRVLMAERGWSRSDLAERSGMSYRASYSILRGQSEPHEKTIGKLAAVLGSSVQFLETGQQNAVVREERAEYGAHSHTLAEAVRVIAEQLHVPEAEVRRAIARLLVGTDEVGTGTERATDGAPQ